MATKPAEKASEIQILELRTGTLDVCILGTSPLICNRVSQKAKWELLAPKGRKTAADRVASLKHDPLQEFRDSPYMLDAKDFPEAAIGVMAGGFKRSRALGRHRSAVWSEFQRSSRASSVCRSGRMGRACIGSDSKGTDTQEGNGADANGKECHAEER
jgi:hypothetical protein